MGPNAEPRKLFPKLPVGGDSGVETLRWRLSRLAAIGIGAKEGEGGVAESFAEGFAEGFAGYRLLVLGARVPTLG